MLNSGIICPLGLLKTKPPQTIPHQTAQQLVHLGQKIRECPLVLFYSSQICDHQKTTRPWECHYIDRYNSEGFCGYTGERLYIIKLIIT